MRSVFILLAGFIICSSFISNRPLYADSIPKPPSISAQTAALIDVQSGRILFSKQGDKQMRIASLTKIMTAIVAIENGKLSDIVKVSSKAFNKEGSSLYLKLGEEMSLQNMLYGLMLRSGNDAAVAIAEQVGGSFEGFVYLMNEKAAFIGMDHTHFANPHGLDVKDHFSTANDMAKLTAYALQNPTFRDIVKTKVKTAPNPGETWSYKWINKNKMLSIYDGADGVKTGYTKLALRCLISSATRDGRQLAVVTLNDSNDWADHSQLLDYGFKNYPLQYIVEKGTLVSGTPLAAGATLRYPLASNEMSFITQKIILNDHKSINYRFGQIGMLQFFLRNVMIGSVPLIGQEPDTMTSSSHQRGFGIVIEELIAALFNLNAS